MTNKAKKPAGNTGPVTTLNNSSQQCRSVSECPQQAFELNLLVQYQLRLFRPSKRHAGMKRWQATPGDAGMVN